MKSLTFLITFVFFLFSPKHINAQIVLGRLVHGGNRSEIIKVYSDKRKMNEASKKKTAGNDHVKYYLVRPDVLKSITNYIYDNCRSSSNYLGELSDDIYMISIESKKKCVCKLNDKSGKTFLLQLKTWIERTSFAKECNKLTASIEGSLIQNI
jgi:hypothetical protein